MRMLKLSDPKYLRRLVREFNLRVNESFYGKAPFLCERFRSVSEKVRRLYQVRYSKGSFQGKTPSGWIEIDPESLVDSNGRQVCASRQV